MKKTLIALMVVLTLGGCGTFTAPKFDNVEYGYFTELTSLVRTSNNYCDQPEIMKVLMWRMTVKAETIDTYATYRSKHEQIKEVTSLILKDVKELDVAFRSDTAPSKAYCIGKLQILEVKLKRVLPAIGDLQQ